MGSRIPRRAGGRVPERAIPRAVRRHAFRVRRPGGRAHERRLRRSFPRAVRLLLPGRPSWITLCHAGRVLPDPAGPATGFPGSPAFHAVVNAVVGNPLPAMEMANVQQIDLAYADASELISSFLHVLGYQINGANALTERMKGHEFFDNAALTTAGPPTTMPSTPASVASVPIPAAENYLERWWEPMGRIAKPFVSLHTSRDPLVPVRSADVFAAKVAEAGASEHLLQRTVEAFGHCAFGCRGHPLGFQALVSWVRTGAKASGLRRQPARGAATKTALDRSRLRRRPHPGRRGRRDRSSARPRTRRRPLTPQLTRKAAARNCHSSRAARGGSSCGADVRDAARIGFLPCPVYALFRAPAALLDGG
jgi:hypothetical protein